MDAIESTKKPMCKSVRALHKLEDRKIRIISWVNNYGLSIPKALKMMESCKV